MFAGFWDGEKINLGKKFIYKLSLRAFGFHHFLRGRLSLISSPYAFFLSAHLAFIIADSFFLIAGLIGLRAALVLLAAVGFFPPACAFCFAHLAR